MSQQIIQSKFNNKIERRLNKIFHDSNLPLHFNKTGNKEFTNYQRISLIILFHRSKKSIRDFIDELSESKWVSWLGLRRIPKKSTLHDWLKIFNMKTIRKICKILLPKEIKITAIDGTGFDSWQRSRHYEKRIGEEHMPYAKGDLFVDVKSRKIIDFSLICHRQHDVKIAEKIFKRNNIKNIIGLGDKGYDSENLHKIARANGITFYAPLRKSNKKSSIKKRPKGFYRRKCIQLPDFMGQRSIVEAINSSLKKKQINCLRSKKVFMKQREFGWHIVWYNLRMDLKDSNQTTLNFFIFQIIFLTIPDRAYSKTL
jgi:hypothetical protein